MPRLFHNLDKIMLILRIPGTAGGSKCGRSPSDDGPWGLWGMNQHGELAVVEQAQRAEHPTADRDLFPFNCGEGVREFAGGFADCNLTAKGGNRGCWAGQLCWTAEQVPLSFLLREARRGTAASLSLERRQPGRESLAVELP